MCLTLSYVGMEMKVLQKTCRKKRNYERRSNKKKKRCENSCSQVTSTTKPIRLKNKDMKEEKKNILSCPKCKSQNVRKIRGLYWCADCSCE